MKKIKYVLIYILGIVFYYIVFNDITLFIPNTLKLIQANTSHDSMSNSLIISNFIIMSSINIFILSYIFNLLDNLKNMRKYIFIRTKSNIKINKLIIYTIFRNLFFIFIIKFSIDIFINQFNDIVLLIYLNISIFSTLLLYILIYFLFSFIIKKSNIIFLSIVCLNLISNILYKNFIILKIFTYVDINLSIYLLISKLIIIIILLTFVFLYQNVNKKFIFLKITEDFYD